jgi:hypothetical protein
MSVTSLSGECVVRRGHGEGDFDAKKFCKYLKVKKGPGGRWSQAFYINGKRLTDSERRMVHRWRTGKYKTVRLGTADAFATRFDLPLWEIEQEASRMVS